VALCDEQRDVNNTISPPPPSRFPHLSQLAVDDLVGEGEYQVAAPGKVVGVAFVSGTRTSADKPWQWRQVSLEVDKASLEGRRSERAAAAKAGGYGTDNSAAARELDLTTLEDASAGRRPSPSGVSGPAEREVYIFNVIPGTSGSGGGGGGGGDAQLR